jgi:hypothetical protein
MAAGRLAPPACVRDATDEYSGARHRRQRLEDCTDGGDLAFTRMTALFSS